MASWNGLDWILIAVLAISTARAWMRGLIAALFGLLGFMGGFELASYTFAPAGDWIYERGWFHSLSISRMIAFLAIAISIAVAFDLIGRGVKKSAHAVGFGMVDRTLGAAFGVARGLLLGVAVIVGVSAFGPTSGWAEGSRLSSYFLGAAHAVSFRLPHDLR
jgi:membrane protein required for colicin V production